MKNKFMTDISSIIRQKHLKSGLAEKVFITYTIIMLICRLIVSPILLAQLDQLRTTEITFIISLFLTILFILISDLIKVDWYGKKGNGPIAKLISYFKKRGKKSERNLLLILFILDPFLFFIYLRNGRKHKLIYIIGTWILLLISLLTVSYLWSYMWIGIKIVVGLIF